MDYDQQVAPVSIMRPRAMKPRLSETIEEKLFEATDTAKTPYSISVGDELSDSLENSAEEIGRKVSVKDHLRKMKQIHSSTPSGNRSAKMLEIPTRNETINPRATFKNSLSKASSKKDIPIIPATVQ